MKKIFTYLVIISITFLTLSCSDDKSDNSEPDYILSSLTELIFNQKGRKRKLRLIVYAEPNEENQERKTELKIENELL